MALLGVNIDHVATIREARKTNEPDPVWAASLAELGGADCITIHLREDRRHIQERDLRLLKETTTVKLNLEMACTPEIVKIAIETQPDQVTLVPEKREEVTTEGGLDAVAQRDLVDRTTKELMDAGIEVSLFLDPIEAQITVAHDINASGVEIHTGQYAIARSARDKEAELLRIAGSGAQIRKAGMAFHAGHGLTYRNVKSIAQLEGISELNIGHSIISRAVFVGLTEATRAMKALISNA